MGGFWIGMVGIHEIPLLRIAVFAGIRGFGKEEKGFGGAGIRSRERYIELPQ